MKIPFVFKNSPPSTGLALSLFITAAGLAAAVLLAPGLSLAASFDCNRATTSVEKLICSEHVLSKLDDGLLKMYRELLRSVADPAGLKQEQTKWLRDVRDLCSDSACLEKAYRDRIAALQRVFPVTRADEESDCAASDSGDFPKEGERSFQDPHEVYSSYDGAVKTADELLVWNRTPKEMCFSISTVGTNYHTCSLDGKATAVRKNEYIYAQDECYITFIFRKNKVKVNVSGLTRGGGDGCKSAGCGTNASIDSATYIEARPK